MTPRQRRDVFWVPGAAWAAIAAAVALTCVCARAPIGPWKPWVALAIAAGQAMISGLLLMRLDRSNALVRVTAAAGFAWLSLLFILAFADYLTRAYPL